MNMIKESNFKDNRIVSLEDHTVNHLHEIIFQLKFINFIYNEIPRFDIKIRKIQKYNH